METRTFHVDQTHELNNEQTTNNNNTQKEKKKKIKKREKKKGANPFTSILFSPFSLIIKTRTANMQT